MQPLPIFTIPGKDLVGIHRKTPTLTLAVVRNRGCIAISSSVCISIVKRCIYVCLFSACTLDEGSCSCCLMLREVDKLAMLFNDSLNKLEREYMLTYQSFKKTEGERHMCSNNDVLFYAIYFYPVLSFLSISSQPLCLLRRLVQWQCLQMQQPLHRQQSHCL